MPFRSGEAVYGLLLKKTATGSLGQGLAAIAVLRLFDLLVIAAMALWVLIALILIAAVAGLFLAPGPLRRIASRMQAEQAGEKKGAFIRRCAATLADAFALPLGKRLSLLGLTALLWSLVLVWLGCIFQSTGPALDLFQSLLTGVLGVVGSLLPISAVGTFGPMEGGFAMALQRSGLDPPVAVAHAIAASAWSFAHNWTIALPAWLGLMLNRGGRG